jgi:hypothetical protein
MHFGVDYGARFAGTTVICYEDGNQLVIAQTRKQDADAFC